MNKFLNEMKSEQNYTVTENGAGALKSTMNACLDAFGSLGAMRFSADEDVLRTFINAFNEDRALAVKMAFYFRDIRGGQGTRKQFRTIMVWLANNYPEYVIHNLENFLFFGRGDDYLCLLDTPIKHQVISYLFALIKEDYIHFKANEPISLLAKWLPSENATSEQTKKYARQLIKGFGWTPRQYRKLLTLLRNYIDVTEVKMSAKQWTEIDYEKVPAKAALAYAEAFNRHDEDGYIAYLTKVAMGEAKVNAASLYPVDVVHKALELGYRAQKKDIILTDAMWKSLPNYLEDKDETGICVVDVSGSMSGTPMEVALSLGMYCADKCHGPFQNHFITFSAIPELQEVKGANIVEKLHNMMGANWDMNTNLEAVFDLILDTAKRAHCSQDEIPNKLYIISDMQFDEARGAREHYGSYRNRYTPCRTFMQAMRMKYAAAGYTMPTIVYWNVRASKCGMFQTTFEGENCCMVSGYSASLFKSIIEGTTYEVEEVVTVNKETGMREVVQTLKATVNPMTVMLTTINNERYDRVWVE